MTKRTIELTTVERAYLHDLLQDQINNHEKDENVVFLINKIMYKIEEKEVDDTEEYLTRIEFNPNDLKEYEE